MDDEENIDLKHIIIEAVLYQHSTIYNIRFLVGYLYVLFLRLYYPLRSFDKCMVSKVQQSMS